MKKILLSFIFISLFASDLIFKEIKVNNQIFLVQQKFDNQDILTLKKFEYQTKKMIELLNIYLKNKNFFTSIERSNNPALLTTTNMIKRIIQKNNQLWNQEIEYQNQKYEVIYNFLDTLLKEKELLIDSTTNSFFDKIIKDDIINKAIQIEKSLPKVKKLNKSQIQEVRNFYIIFAQVLENYKNTIQQIKNIKEVNYQIKTNKYFQKAFKEIIRLIDLSKQYAQKNISSLNQWDKITIFY